MGQLYTERHFQFNQPRDQVWEYMTDLRRAMLLDQFHVGIDCTAQEAANPKAGMIVPIHHVFMSWPETRLGRITKFSDYEIAWGESTPKGEYDAFPHSEGWKVDEVDKKTSLVTLWMKGAWQTPVGKRIQSYAWDTVIGPNLDQDVCDLAQAVGADMSRSPDHPVPDDANELMWLMFAQKIDDVPAEDYFGNAPKLYADEIKALKAQVQAEVEAETAKVG
ncbi:hypothetical protein ACWCQQ_37830 [Streptomyces sp. NPDC002143]